MTNKSDKEIIDQVIGSLSEIIALACFTYSLGNFTKTDALVTTAEFIQKSLEDRCPKELLNKLNELKNKKEPFTDSCNWII